MSLILDALNRARDDVNPVPGLATHHRVELVAANRRQYLLWVALSVAVVMIAWLIVERYSAPRPAGDDVDVVASVAQPPPREPASDPVGTDAVVESLPAAAVSVARLEAQEQSQEQAQVAADAGTPPPAVTDGLAVQAEALPEPGFDAEPVQAYSPEENAKVARLYSNPPRRSRWCSATRGLLRDKTMRQRGRQANRRASISTESCARRARKWRTPACLITQCPS
ncbi:MAG: hypothetical protein IPG64_21080 [Haliea sp.]|nr:hypothetical protein [Haliea sp.]